MNKFILRLLLMTILFGCSNDGESIKKVGDKYIRQIVESGNVRSLEEITIDTIGDKIITLKNGYSYYLNSNGDTLEKLYFYNGEIFGNNYYYYSNGKPKLYLAIGQDSNYQPDTLVLIEYDSLGNPNILKNKNLGSPFYITDKRDYIDNYEDSLLKIKGIDSFIEVTSFNFYPPNIYLKLDFYLINQDSSLILKAPQLRIFSKKDFIQKSYFKINASNTYSLYREWSYKIFGMDTMTFAYEIEDFYKNNQLQD